jgi:hypothetical protein
MVKRLYLIAFDLRRPGDYASLSARLTAMGAQQILERVWAVLFSVLMAATDGGHHGGTNWAIPPIVNGDKSWPSGAA